MSASLRGGVGGILPSCVGFSRTTYRGGRQCQAGSLTGAVASKGNGGAQRFPQNGWKSFTECKGIRELDCETYKSSRVENGLSDPVVPHGRAIAQRIKATPGITGLSPQEFTSTGRFGTSMSAHRILGL